MKILVGRISDRGDFTQHLPVPGAEIIEWVEPQAGGVRLGGTGVPAQRQPDISVHCRGWAVEVGSLDEFLSTLDYWRTDHATSVEVFVRDRGRSDLKDLVVVLLDYDGDDYFRAQVVPQRRAEP